jgi:hypothetical protein
MPGWKDVIRVRATFLGVAGPIWFGRMWRKGWERRRTECIRRALPRVVAWTLGRRRSTFWAGPVKGVHIKKGDRRWETIDAEAEEWVLEGRWIASNWRLVWREMVAVVGGVLTMSIFGSIWMWNVFT